MEYNDRQKISSIKGVKKVIQQNTHDYTKNLKRIKPDFVVHGDDWKQGVQSTIRSKVIKELKKWGGKLVEFPYTKGNILSKLIFFKKEIGTTPDIRAKQLLKRILTAKKLSRFLDIHNGLSGLIVENTKVEIKGKIEEFTNVGSSLTNSTAKGNLILKL